MKLTASFERQRNGALASMEQAAANTRPLLRDLAQDLRGSFDQQFASGDGWAALLFRTIRGKGSATRLVDQGDLRRSLTVRGAPGSIERYGQDEVLVATRDAAAGPLQRGARGMPPRNPARVDMRRLLAKASDTTLDHFTGRSGTFGRLGL